MILQRSWPCRLTVGPLALAAQETAAGAALHTHTAMPRYPLAEILVKRENMLLNDVDECQSLNQPNHKLRCDDLAVSFIRITV